MVAKVPLAPSRERLPDPTGHFKTLEDKDREFLRELIAALTREFDRRSPIDEPIAQRLLFSPNGTVYALKVADNGTLATTALWVPP